MKLKSFTGGFAGMPRPGEVKRASNNNQPTILQHFASPSFQNNSSSSSSSSSSVSSGNSATTNVTEVIEIQDSESSDGKISEVKSFPLPNSRIDLAPKKKLVTNHLLHDVLQKVSDSEKLQRREIRNFQDSIRVITEFQAQAERRQTELLQAVMNEQARTNARFIQQLEEQTRSSRQLHSQFCALQSSNIAAAAARSSSS